MKKYTVGLSFSNSPWIQLARLILVEEKFYVDLFLVFKNTFNTNTILWLKDGINRVISTVLCF